MITKQTIEGYFDPDEQGSIVHVIGAGATGSWLVNFLVRTGLTDIHIYDFDDVEIKNLNNQGYSKYVVGMNKAEACVADIEDRLLEDDADSVVTVHKGKVGTGKDCFPMTFEPNMEHTVFILTDTIESRLDIMEMLEDEPFVTGVIETRLGVGDIDVWFIDPSKPYDEWKASLAHALEVRKAVALDPNVDDLEVTPCGSPFALSHIAAMCAGKAMSVYLQSRVKGWYGHNQYYDVRSNAKRFIKEQH